MQRIIILGAAGRDFHDFNVYWRQRDDVQVVCFTATQIPDIDGRRYPASLAGPRYPDGIPIEPEADLEALVARFEASQVALSYSDLRDETVMHLVARAQAAGAGFRVLAAAQTMVDSSKPVIAVCAVRTGCGKSQTTRRVAQILREAGRTVAVVRHPMPYGDLEKQACQRFATLEDMDRHECTIEEREEYEPHVEQGNIVFAGVDYERILRQAESECDVVLWDGGNNDLPFYRPDLHVVIADPHRAGHESRYYPSETNARMADLVLINKADTAPEGSVEQVRHNVAALNSRAEILVADSPITVEDRQAVPGKRVLVIEDGPTLTHGEMGFGAGYVAAEQLGAAEIVDPRPYAVGSLRDVFAKYAQLERVLPAMGYGTGQIRELEETINKVPCDLVLVATPIDLGRLLTIDRPSLRVRYELRERDPETFRARLLAAVER